jgi:hypothetical protein
MMAVATQAVQFCCGLPAHPDDCTASDALMRLREPAFVRPIRVAVPRSSSGGSGMPRGRLRDLLDALQDRNGGRTSEGQGSCAFRAVYRFATPIAHASDDGDCAAAAASGVAEAQPLDGGGGALDGTVRQAESDRRAGCSDGGGSDCGVAGPAVDPLRSGFSDQTLTDQQRMIDCMFKPAPHGRLAAWVPLASIRITPAKRGQKTPHNQRAELFMWQAHHALPHHRHPLLELDEQMQVRA